MLNQEEVGVMEKNTSMVTGYLNCDGYKLKTKVDLDLAIRRKDVGIFCLVETKLRKDQKIKISKLGFEVFESRREDCNSLGMKDKKGGGLAILTKKREGLVFKQYNPKIVDPSSVFVDKERLWVTYESEGRKSAVCVVYLGWNASDDRHVEWNEKILKVLAEEIYQLRAKGFRINLQGDFNAWVGSDLLDYGIPGNCRAPNKNGIMFKDFLRSNNLLHLNGACRQEGVWETRVSRGLWTRHDPDYKSSTILDYSVVSAEHFDSVIWFEVDDQGKLGGAADHNMLFTKLKDTFVFKTKMNRKEKMGGWDIREEVKWDPFRKIVQEDLEKKPNGGDVECEQNILVQSLVSGLESAVGRRSPPKSTKDTILPKNILDLMKDRRSLEKIWKTEKTLFATERSNIPPNSLIIAKENLKEKEVEVEEAVTAYERKLRFPVKKLCKMKNKRGRQAFWSYVSRKYKTNTDISAIQNKATGVLHTNPAEIIDEVFCYIKDIFSGVDPVEHQDDEDEEGRSGEELHPGDQAEGEPNGDHGYDAGPKKLHSTDSSKCPVNDPGGYLDKNFSEKEVRELLKAMGNGKAAGWDSIPNEALKEAPPCFVVRLVKLYNRVKNGEGIPSSWKKGRLVLVHKKG